MFPQSLQLQQGDFQDPTCTFMDCCMVFTMHHHIVLINSYWNAIADCLIALLDLARAQAVLDSERCLRSLLLLLLYSCQYSATQLLRFILNLMLSLCQMTVKTEMLILLYFGKLYCFSSTYRIGTQNFIFFNFLFNSDLGVFLKPWLKSLLMSWLP